MSIPKISEILLTEEVENRIKKLPKDIQKRLKEKIDLLKENPLHPSLHFKKYRTSKYEGIFWEFRINSKYRGILKQELDKNGNPTTTFYLVAVDKHDILERFNKLL